MKKQFLAFLSTGLFVSTSFALPYDGFYIGAAIGGSQAAENLASKANASITPLVVPAFGTTANAAAHSKLTQSSILADLNVGFSHVFSGFYAGLEMDGRWTNNTVKSKANFNTAPTATTAAVTTLKNKLHIRDELAVTFNPGIAFYDTTLLYGKVGPAWGNIKANNKVLFSATSPAGTTSGKNEFTGLNGYKQGLRWGFGIEHFIADCLSLKLEYTNTDYGHIHTDTISTGPTPGPLVALATASEKISLSDNTVLLGIAYHIG